MLQRYNQLSDPQWCFTEAASDVHHVKSTRRQRFAYGVWRQFPPCGKRGLTAHCWSMGCVGIRVYTAQYRQLKKLYTVITLIDFIHSYSSTYVSRNRSCMYLQLNL